MAGAEEVFAALERVPGASTRRSCSTAGARACGRRRASREIHYFAFIGLTDTFNRRNRTPPSRSGLATGIQIVATARDAGLQVTVATSARVRLPFEGVVDPGCVIEHVRQVAGVGARTRSCSPTRSAWRCPGR